MSLLKLGVVKQHKNRNSSFIRVNGICFTLRKINFKICFWKSSLLSILPFAWFQRMYELIHKKFQQRAWLYMALDILTETRIWDDDDEKTLSDVVYCNSALFMVKARECILWCNSLSSCKQVSPASWQAPNDASYWGFNMVTFLLLILKVQYGFQSHLTSTFS